MTEVAQLHRLGDLAIQDNQVAAVLGEVSILTGIVDRF